VENAPHASEASTRRSGGRHRIACWFNDQSLDTTTQKMPRETDPSNNAKSFLLQALRENVRIDGRGFDEFRALDLSFGDEYGVATVQLGKTRVMVRVSSEVVKASADRKFDGVFTISTELSPIASPAFEVGR
jgi:exosome complex component RRP45